MWWQQHKTLSRAAPGCCASRSCGLVQRARQVCLCALGQPAMRPPGLVLCVNKSLLSWTWKRKSRLISLLSSVLRGNACAYIGSMWQSVPCDVKDRLNAACPAVCCPDLGCVYDLGRRKLVASLRHRAAKDSKLISR